MLKEFVCIMCPQGCSLEVEMEAIHRTHQPTRR